MEPIYNFIESSPELAALVFAATNGVWLGITFFLRQRHERNLQNFKHGFDLDLEKRRKLYEMKSRQYENYVGRLDDFGRKNQVEIPSRMQPMITRFFENYLKAEDDGDQEASRMAITTFSEQVSTINQEGLNDYLKIKSESNKLKLTATPKLLEVFTQLEEATKVSFDFSNKFMGEFLNLLLANDQAAIADRQSVSMGMAEVVSKRAEDLMVAMREELQEI